ncbi:acyl-protein synthase [Lentzea tibetensis]|uniref:Acyl-protein synthase n=1 Tax=Lentzea tibetensis TaxID=2591470 RepID=A0A563F038_9PSEU|nr:acyl-protein synthase [Lentzea tibetensis]TWP53347.1 acyl-protein synthase [Lentzea tibetensis]
MNQHLGPVTVPDSARLGAVQQLCDIADPYDHSDEALFIEAMNESNRWHAERSPFFASLWDGRPIDNVVEQPYVHANFFKMHEVLSIPRADVAVHATSSGTTGQKSQMFWDSWTHQAGQRMVARIYDHYGWIDAREPVHYLLYTNQPTPSVKLGSSMTGQFMTDFAPVQSVHYGLAHTGTGHEFDAFGCIRALQEFADSGLPVRIFGFPAFLSFTLDRMRAMGLPPLKLNERSLVLFGGGWKSNADKQISKTEMRDKITDMLGIPDGRVRDGYGSVEHSIPYLECAHHNLHVPTWSRALVRDVKTLDVLGFGEPGYLQFVSPYITSAPAQSVLMGDLAALHAPDECGCGAKTPWFEILGRAGVSRNKSCAIAAAELLKGKS